MAAGPSFNARKLLQNVMNEFSVLALLVAGAIILWLWFGNADLSEEAAKSQSEVNRISGRIQQEAMKQFQVWRLKEFEALKLQEAEVAEREAHVKLADWKVTSEAAFRADAIQRSRSVIVGKVTEHIVPYLPEFNYNPKDARFIGSPVDFVVFDRLDEGAVQQVVFIEVKTGSRLQGRSLEWTHKIVRPLRKQSRAGTTLPRPL